jgi:hypothetical protein
MTIRLYGLLLIALLCAACAPSIDSRNACAGDDECFVGESCVLGHCEPSAEGDAGGQPDTAQPDADGVGEADAAGDAAVDTADGEDTGEDTGGDVVDTASATAFELRATISLVIASHDAGGYIDVGFCPDPGNETELGQGGAAGTLTCDDAVMVRFGGLITTGGSLDGDVIATTSEPTSSSATPPIEKGALVVVGFVATVDPEAPDAPVDVSVAVVKGAEETLFATKVKSTYRNMQRFGLWNLDPPGLLTSLCGTMADLSTEGTIYGLEVAKDGAPLDLTGLGAKDIFQSGQAWKPAEVGWSFEAKRCEKAWFLLELEDKL